MRQLNFIKDLITSYYIKDYQITSSYELAGLLYKQADKIVIIENISTQKDNDAYILSANRTDLKKILKDQHHHSDYAYYFHDINYIDIKLYFFINICGDDFYLILKVVLSVG